MYGHMMLHIDVWSYYTTIKQNMEKKIDKSFWLLLKNSKQSTELEGLISSYYNNIFVHSLVNISGAIQLTYNFESFTTQTTSILTLHCKHVYIKNIV